MRLPAGPLGRLRSFIDNDPSVQGFDVRDGVTVARLRAQQIQFLLRYTPYMLLANILNAMIFLLAFRQSALQGAALIFAAVVTSLVGYQYWRWKQMQSRVAPKLASVRAPRRAFYNAFMLGAVWAVPPLLFIGSDTPGSNMIVASLCIGMMCGGAFALAAVPAAAVGFVTPIALGSIFGMAHHSLEYGVELASLLFVFLFVIVKSSFALSAMIAERMLGQFEQERQRETIGILLGEFEENASDWLWETDKEGRLVYVSPGFFRAIGMAGDEVIGARVLDILRLRNGEDENGSRGLGVLKEITRTQRHFRDVVLKLETPAGRCWWSLTGRPIYDHAQEYSGYRGFCADITERRENEDRISHLARHDSVTGLANRVLFGEQVTAAIARSSREHSKFSIFYIDLDGFKEVNDTFGHAIGDKLLRAVGERVRTCVGTIGTAARLGGDEFAVIQEGEAPLADAGAFAEALISEISSAFEIDGFSIQIGASIGIVCAPEHGMDPERLLINADLALYRAKSAGKGTWRIFEQAMDEEARARRRLEDDLRNAIANDEFRLVFQPLVALSGRRVTTCEALIRWRHPVRGDVSPADFIPLAEETGLIFAIGEWVINEACRVAAQWPRDIRVAVNLSPAQFHSHGLMPAIRRALAKHGVAPQRLEIEVTESVLVSNVERVQLILGALSAIGVRIALDDFGTGYSSLGYLRQIKFDKLKIDRSFVRELSSDYKCAAIVRAVIALARELGIRVTAEGVETAEQVAILEREGCAEVQGFYFSRPVEVDAIPSLFAGEMEGRCTKAA